MTKRDEIRRIDLRPYRLGIGIINIASTSGGVPTQPAPDPTDPIYIPPDDNVIDDMLYVGRREGPHVGLFRFGREILLQAVDTANVPFFSVGAIDYATNTTWLKLGYEGFPQIRLSTATDDIGDPEQHRGLSIDAEALTGIIPTEVLGPATQLWLLDDSGEPLLDDSDYLLLTVGVATAGSIGLGTTDDVTFNSLTLTDSLTVGGEQSWKVVSKDADYTAASETIILVDASGGAVTITLPAVASSTGIVYIIKKTDSSANAVTVDGANAETIDGGTTTSITTQYEAVMIACDGSAWYTI